VLSDKKRQSVALNNGRSTGFMREGFSLSSAPLDKARASVLSDKSDRAWRSMKATVPALCAKALV
jgi:hypothetical protein